jgi:hypothetical protein
MATNRDLLKEAIADAKAVKETAIANAKAALQEAFTPQVQALFAAKLQEIEKEDVEEMYGKSEDEKMKMEEADDMKMDEADEVYESEDDINELDLEELLRELEEEETAEGLYEAEEEEEESEEEEEESEEGEDEGEPLDLEDMTDEDLKSMIEDVIKDMINSGELEAGHEGEGEEESEESEEEEVDLAELLKEIEEMEEKETVDELFGLGKSPKEKLFNQLSGFFKSPFATKLPGADKLAQLDPKSPEFEKLVGELVSGNNPDLSRSLDSWSRSPKDKGGIASTTQGSKWLADLRAIFGEKVFTTPAAGKDSAQATLGMRESKALKAELDEALKTINALKSELNEINLLNAKLLYTNKIFKAKNLNENQKVKVLSSFDKATTVGEVKMVFETLNEGIKVSKNTIKENLGSASKAMATPNAKKPIVESNDAFLRMQKLAGII